MPKPPPPPQQPQNLHDLLAWITATGPYNKLNHATAPFPNVHDFMIRELEVALLQAVQKIKTARENLRTIPGPHQAFVECADLATTSHALVLRLDRSGIMEIDHAMATRLVLAAKYRDCLSYRNSIVALAIGIRKLKEERGRVRAAVEKWMREGEVRGWGMGMLRGSTSTSTAVSTNGDEDDWFGDGAEMGTPASTPPPGQWEAQERLYEEIEVRLAGVGAENSRVEEVVGLPRMRCQSGEGVGGLLPRTRYEPGEKGERARQGTIVVAMDDVFSAGWRDGVGRGWGESGGGREG